MQRNILEYLEKSALRYGEKTAVTDGDISYSYAELLHLSQKIGSALINEVQPGKPVCVLAEKGIDTLAVFLGIVAAGAFYVLLNPELPQGRLSKIKSVLDAKCLITDKAHLTLAETLIDKSHIFLIEEIKDTPVNEKALQARRAHAIDSDPLYANFTSGSTGIPKGVVISHHSVIDFIDQFVSIFSIDETDVIANQAPFDFDVSVKDIYASLACGATLLIVPKDLFSKPAQLLDFLCDHAPTTMIWAVSALLLINTCHGLDYRVPTSVKRVLFSGEAMPLKPLQTWMNHLPEAQFVNLYGPTEITCNCTYHIIERDRDYTCGIPIGKAFPNEEVFLLDDDTLVSTPDTPGEICVRGSALALGYFNAQEQTDAAFVQNPLKPYYPDKIYRTGDMGIYNASGEIIFCGRKDFQVKYLGHRIELEEIERAINALPEIERTCVIFDEKKQRLYGFYIGGIDKKVLHAQLKSALPTYMIPGSLVQFDSFPITKNGKIDRRQLLEWKRR